MRGLAACLLVAGLALLASSAGSEMYKCKGPDGHTLYTSDKSQCPGAKAHQSTGRIQSVPAGAVAPPHYGRTQESPAAAHDAHEQALAASWRNKKDTARSDLARVSQRLVYVQRAVKWCNRGHDLYVENEDGIRRSYSCTEVKRESVELTEQKAQLDAYLNDGGLEEDCRRSGCLPGWIRD